MRNPTPICLFVAGPAGTGKTIAAEHLARHHGFIRVSLGHLCANEAEALGWPMDRYHLQVAGDLLRSRDTAALARLALRFPLPESASVVIDGVRLPEEGRFLREAGYLAVGMTARRETRKRCLRARGERWPVPPHHTETAVGNVEVDYVLAGDDLELADVRRDRIGRMLRWAHGRATEPR